MNRRKFLMSAGIAAVGAALPRTSQLFAVEKPPEWRTFELTTRVEIADAAGATRVWLPETLLRETAYQRSLGQRFAAPGGTVELVKSEIDGLGIVSASFPAGVKPVVVLTSQVSTRNIAVDLAHPVHHHHQADSAELQHFLRSTSLMPLDGLVKTTSDKITAGATNDVEKARAIYEWIVDNTFRDPKVRGCGTGDVRWLLQSGDLGGKCADLNALYVALARAAGIPARDAYGIRVVKSELGYKSLGASSEKVSKAQHCRAEVYLKKFGWVPVDPADVRKVVLEEPPGNRPLTDEMVVAARKRLFGSWEMNWVAFNFAHDVKLPGSEGAPVPFFMYPQAEVAGKRRDSLDPDGFHYEITAHEVMASV
ncbi:MAG: transglutaminase-like domain-containing protein [Acidobacteriota bacterium]|nr:transglutaminase-like domain-containing protein [Acidobacteriota bacterium]